MNVRKNIMAGLVILGIVATFTLLFTACDPLEGSYEEVLEIALESAKAVPVIMIAAQPAPDTNVEQNYIAESLEVTATVTESATLSYQWHRSSDAGVSLESLSGEKGAIFEIPKNLTAVGSPYYFYCLLSASGGAASVASNVAKVNVSPEGTPVITINTNPASTINVDADNINVTLSVTAGVTKDAIPSYEWRYNTTNSFDGSSAAPGTRTNASYTVPTTLTAGNHYYFCIVSATKGGFTIEPARSSISTVAVTRVVRISTQPSNPSSMIQGNISGSMTVGATVYGGGSATYQWHRSNSSGVSTETMAGGTNASFGIPTNLTAAASPHYFFCRISASGAASVDSRVVTVTITAPVITIGTQPNPTTNVNAGSITGNLSLSATVTGGATLSYQWYKNTTNTTTTGSPTAQTGATSAVFAIPTTLADGSHYYFCIVSANNGASSVNSNMATVVVSNVAVTDVFIDQTSPVTVYIGGTVTLTASVQPTNATNKAVTWSKVSDTTGGNVTVNPETGVVTVPSNATAGTVMIRVTTSDSNKTRDCTINVKSPNFQVGGIYYKVMGPASGSTDVKVTNKLYTDYYSGGEPYKDSYSGPTVTIPATVTFDGVTHAVKRIGTYAFYGSTGLTSVTLPNGITDIEEQAFRECTELTSVTLPTTGFTSIGFYAFENCKKLSSITLPSGLQYLGDRAFSRCVSLPSLNIPASVTLIETYAFHDSSNLSLTASAGGKYSVNGGVLFEGNGSNAVHTLFWMPYTITEYNIPSGTVTINRTSTYYRIKIEKISIPASVTNIAVENFSYCDSLIEVKVAWTAAELAILTIGDYFFDGTNRANITLLVPNAHKSAYESHLAWGATVNGNKFNIVGY